MPIKPPSGRLEISAGELKALQRRIKERNLLESDWQMVHAMSEVVQCLSEIIEEKNTSIGRLCKYLLGAPTETAKNILPQKEKSRGDQPHKAPIKGHGRKAASAYVSADRVRIEHPELKPGALCPGCEKGKVYPLSLPSFFVHIKGASPLKATVYERARLRCNLCGDVYVPELPPDVQGDKYDDSATAMIGFLKYGCGLPFYRIEKLQANLGSPVAASTQWDVLNSAALPLLPVYDTLINYAAQGETIHNDDTTMKVLAFLKEQDPESTRKGIYTTGIVSKWQGRLIALFMTGRQHAGENMTDLLKRRATGLSPPIQMCDAATRNVSKQFEVILANCLTHARRQFVELVDRFPDDCAYVIEQLGKVYHFDDLTKEQGLSDEARLVYHQEHSGPVMAELESWCKQQLEEKIVEPNSGLGKAITYMLKHWKKLTRFLQVPGAPLDNNLCERALKYAIINRKNAMFYKTQRGAYVGDLFMSLIHTCQLAGTNPLAYITWLLKNSREIEKSPQSYMPWNYTQG
jgi:hypothetical protein